MKPDMTGSCSRYNKMASCSLSSPLINKNDWIAIGWNASKGVVSEWNENTEKIFTKNIIWSAVIKRNLIYTGLPQQIILSSGVYQIELWGAGSSRSISAFGGYTKGDIYLKTNQTFHLFIGELGSINAGGWNGGGYGAPSGGGATDLRLIDGNWNDLTSLSSRIMVAAGGGGVDAVSFQGNAGGLIGYDGGMAEGRLCSPTGATQIMGGTSKTHAGCDITILNGTFGVGASSTFSVVNENQDYGGGGGGGYYGGGSGSVWGAGSGGSSYISGHTGCVAITSADDLTPKNDCMTGTTENVCSIHYSNIIFTNTQMIDGNGYSWTNTKEGLTAMPNPAGGDYLLGQGHMGNGYARITKIN